MTHDVLYGLAYGLLGSAVALLGGLWALTAMAERVAVEMED